MVEVNTLELKTIIESLNKFIAEYEDVKLNLFNQLNDSCINWQDGNSLVFDSKIYLDKQEADLILSSLINKKQVYDLVHDKYIEIGKKIKCNLDNKEVLLNAIDNCINQVTDIIKSFQNVDKSFGYSEIGLIVNQEQKMIDVKNELVEFKTEISKLYEQIEKIEAEINAKVKALEEVKISEFDFSIV